MNDYVLAALGIACGIPIGLYLVAYARELRKALIMLANERRYLGYAPPPLLVWRMAWLLLPQPPLQCARWARRRIAHHG